MGAPGQLVVNRYRLVRALGQGRTGTVWEGHDNLLDRPVAVKEVVPPPGLGLKGQAEFMRRITLAANAATRVTNKNLVAVYDVAEDDDRPWVVMELLPSRPLSAIIAGEGPLPPERVARIGRRVLDGLSAGHAAGLVHGDVRPANILIGYEGRVALADLGIPVTDGEPPFRAPEGARSGPAADLWALGATLYTAAVGTPPIVDTAAGDAAAAHGGGVAAGEMSRARHAPPRARRPADRGPRGAAPGRPGRRAAGGDRPARGPRRARGA